MKPTDGTNVAEPDNIIVASDAFQLIESYGLPKFLSGTKGQTSYVS